MSSGTPQQGGQQPPGNNGGDDRIHRLLGLTPRQWLAVGSLLKDLSPTIVMLAPTLILLWIAYQIPTIMDHGQSAIHSMIVAERSEFRALLERMEAGHERELERMEERHREQMGRMANSIKEGYFKLADEVRKMRGKAPPEEEGRDP